MPAPVVVALYRVVQEALTNVLNTRPARRLGPPGVGSDGVSVGIENRAGAGSPTLSTTGAGYGLQGIGERVALLGGRMEAGPTPGGWRVSAGVPLPLSVAAETGGVRS